MSCGRVIYHYHHQHLSRIFKPSCAESYLCFDHHLCFEEICNQIESMLNQKLSPKKRYAYRDLSKRDGSV